MNDRPVIMRPFRNSTGSKTVEGIIPHLELFVNAGILRAPVKVDVVSNYRTLEAHPVRREGGLVYALPGGGEFQA